MQVSLTAYIKRQFQPSGTATFAMMHIAIMLGLVTFTVASYWVVQHEERSFREDRANTLVEWPERSGIATGVTRMPDTYDPRSLATVTFRDFYGRPATRLLVELPYSTEEGDTVHVRVASDGGSFIAEELNSDPDPTRVSAIAYWVEGAAGLVLAAAVSMCSMVVYWWALMLLMLAARLPLALSRPLIRLVALLIRALGTLAVVRNASTWLTVRTFILQQAVRHRPKPTWQMIRIRELRGRLKRIGPSPQRDEALSLLAQLERWVQTAYAPEADAVLDAAKALRDHELTDAQLRAEAATEAFANMDGLPVSL